MIDAIFQKIREICDKHNFDMETEGKWIRCIYIRGTTEAPKVVATCWLNNHGVELATQDYETLDLTEHTHILLSDPDFFQKVEQAIIPISTEETRTKKNQRSDI
jgi:hypothetical protein